jgi:hypothetical protein
MSALDSLVHGQIWWDEESGTKAGRELAKLRGEVIALRNDLKLMADRLKAEESKNKKLRFELAKAINVLEPLASSYALDGDNAEFGKEAYVFLQSYIKAGAK